MAGRGWDDLRARVFERSGGRCEQCRERDGQHVHHLRYNRGEGNYRMVALEFLVHLCMRCHSKRHLDHPFWKKWRAGPRGEGSAATLPGIPRKSKHQKWLEGPTFGSDPRGPKKKKKRKRKPRKIVSPKLRVRLSESEKVAERERRRQRALDKEVRRLRR